MRVCLCEHTLITKRAIAWTPIHAIVVFVFAVDLITGGCSRLELIATIDAAGSLVLHCPSGGLCALCCIVCTSRSVRILRASVAVRWTPGESNQWILAIACVLFCYFLGVVGFVFVSCRRRGEKPQSRACAVTRLLLNVVSWCPFVIPHECDGCNECRLFII